MSATYRCLFKWLVLSIAIGVIAGLGAVAVLLALRYTTNFLLGYLAGYDIPTPVSEGGDPGSAGFPRPWAVPLITMIGALLSALVVARFAPEAVAFPQILCSGYGWIQLVASREALSAIPLWITWWPR